MHRCAPVKENVQNEALRSFDSALRLICTATKAVTKKNALSQPEPFQNLSQSQALDHGLLCHPLFYFPLLCFVSTWSWVVSPSVGLCALPIPPNPLGLFVLRPGDQVACQKSNTNAKIQNISDNTHMQTHLVLWVKRATQWDRVGQRQDLECMRHNSPKVLPCPEGE